MSVTRQVSCLQAVDGWETMYDYDLFRPEVRKRLRESSFNLCAACVIELAWEMPLPEDSAHFDAVLAMNQLRAIEQMEAMVRGGA